MTTSLNQPREQAYQEEPRASDYQAYQEEPRYQAYQEEPRASDYQAYQEEPRYQAYQEEPRDQAITKTIQSTLRTLQYLSLCNLLLLGGFIGWSVHLQWTQPKTKPDFCLQTKHPFTIKWCQTDTHFTYHFSGLPPYQSGSWYLGQLSQCNTTNPPYLITYNGIDNFLKTYIETTTNQGKISLVNQLRQKIDFSYNPWNLTFHANQDGLVSGSWDITSSIDIRDKTLVVKGLNSKVLACLAIKG